MMYISEKDLRKRMSKRSKFFIKYISNFLKLCTTITFKTKLIAKCTRNITLTDVALMKIMFIIMKTAITLLFFIGFEKAEYHWIQDNNAYFLLLLSRNVLITYFRELSHQRF